MQLRVSSLHVSHAEQHLFLASQLELHPCTGIFFLSAKATTAESVAADAQMIFPRPHARRALRIHEREHTRGHS